MNFRIHVKPRHRSDSILQARDRLRDILRSRLQLRGTRMSNDQRAYYLARAAMEAELAERADDPNAAFVHRQLQSRYERLASGELQAPPGSSGFGPDAVTA